MGDDEYWRFPARVTRIVDGDTLDVEVDLGFYVYAHQRIRLMDVDTAEVYGVSHDSEEYAEGSKHSEFTREWCDEDTDGWPLTLVTEKATGKYGRWVGDLYRKRDDSWLTHALTAEFPEVAEDD